MKEAWLEKTIANSVEVIIHTPALWMNLNATPPSFPFRRSNFLRGVSLHTPPPLLLLSLYHLSPHVISVSSPSSHLSPLLYIDIYVLQYNIIYILYMCVGIYILYTLRLLNPHSHVTVSFFLQHFRVPSFFCGLVPNLYAA